jgi:predicted histone-like DNA-binding protein
VKSSANYGKYYARTMKGSEVTLDDIEREIEHSCSATRGDVKLVLQTFHDVWKRHLQQGHRVNLNALELGRYHITVKSRMADTPEIFTARTHITGFELNHTPTGHWTDGNDRHIQREVTKGCKAQRVK